MEGEKEEGRGTEGGRRTLPFLFHFKSEHFVHVRYHIKVNQIHLLTYLLNFIF